MVDECNARDDEESHLHECVSEIVDRIVTNLEEIVDIWNTKDISCHFVKDLKINGVSIDDIDVRVAGLLDKLKESTLDCEEIPKKKRQKGTR